MQKPVSTGTRAVRLRMISNVPLVVRPSGGIDFLLLAALILQAWAAS